MPNLLSFDVSSNSLGNSSIDMIARTFPNLWKYVVTPSLILPHSLPHSLSGSKRLCIANNRIDRINASITSLSVLEYLNVSGNHLSTLPNSMSFMSSLKHLDASHTHLRELPPSFGDWNQDGKCAGLLCLRTLILRGNQLEAFVPHGKKELPSLTHLDLSCNRFTSLSPSLVLDIGPTLNRLNLARNAITDLPIGVLGAMKHLVSLNLSHNRIRELPDDIAFLPALQTLNLSHNLLTALPDSISHLVSLSSLLVASNKLATFPPSIGSLQHTLTRLVAHDNPFDTLPSSFQLLNNLETITLEDVRIIASAESIEKLPPLKESTSTSSSSSSSTTSTSTTSLAVSSSSSSTTPTTATTSTPSPLDDLTGGDSPTIPPQQSEPLPAITISSSSAIPSTELIQIEKVRSHESLTHSLLATDPQQQ